jgi:tRNA(fMet)-specific endonuclease VapC
MMRRASYLLDTNTFSGLVKDPGGAIAQQIAVVLSSPGTALGISIIVAAEVRFGVAKKGSPRLAKQVETVLASIHILPLEAGVDRHYGRIRAELERAGMIIGANDLLIAAHALATDSILVTSNVREFSTIRGLKYEDWLGR